MAETPTPVRTMPTFAWWLVLGLVGLDYFSTLAYLPSIAVEAVGRLAPLAAIGVVAVTLLLAVPVYFYVVGRSPGGQGATGLLDQHVRGWTGKLLLLVLLGFVATDFVITRTLSVADAAAHLLGNSLCKDTIASIVQSKESALDTLPDAVHAVFSRFWTEQLILTMALTILCFAFWALLSRGFTATFLRIGAVVVGVYLLLTGLIVGSCLFYLLDHRELVTVWWKELGQQGELPLEGARGGLGLALFVLFLGSFPQMAIGLSGFELSMATVPLIRGRAQDSAEQPRGRVRRARVLMFVAALIMSVFVPASIMAVTLLVPEVKMREGGIAQHRALAYLAHGAGAEQSSSGSKAEEISPLFGETFGTIYDLSTAAILCLAGASSALGMRDVVPHYLARYGMQLHWAQRTGVILHLFNLVVLVVTVVFHASVSAQQWAYATSVQALLAGAAVAATLDLRARWRGTWLRPIVSTPFALAAFFFLLTGALTTLLNGTGLAIALAFVLVTLITAFVSRWLRSTELRFDGFTFADDSSRSRWEQISRLDFQVLVPHRPGTVSLAEKDQEIRSRHRIGPDVPVILVEVEKGDPSDFMHAPLMEVAEEAGRVIIRVSHCASVAHVLAAIGLAFREVGKPPELHFGWSDESPLAANLNFLLLGEGNVPWMVQALVRKAEPDPSRRPRVVIG
jgi:hypothetical protein